VIDGIDLGKQRCDSLKVVDLEKQRRGLGMMGGMEAEGGLESSAVVCDRPEKSCKAVVVAW
jgi:hypothetical protein